MYSVNDAMWKLPTSEGALQPPPICPDDGRKGGLRLMASDSMKD